MSFEVFADAAGLGNVTLGGGGNFSSPNASDTDVPAGRPSTADMNNSDGTSPTSRNVTISPPSSCSFDCGQQTNPVVDESVIFSFYAGIVLGIISLTAFSILWKYVKVYTSRQHLKQVSFKPRDVPVSACWGLQRYWGWLVPVLMTRTEDIYLAAGLDAVVMLKTIEYGVQIFTPMAMLSLAILVPVHLKGGALPESNAQEAVPFKRFTIANLKPQSELEGISIYWLHFALAYVFVFYSLWLMNYHYEDMVHLRRKNLVHGEDHHKYVQPGPVDELPKAAGSGSPTRGSQDRSASGAYDDTMLESWKGYHSQPAFIPGSEGDREGMPGPLNILHAPLERSPTINDRAASGTLMSVNASMDLGSTFPPDGVQHPRPPSVGPPPTSTRARRLLHAITPGAKMQAAREQTLGLAFTDMIRAPPPMSMSRPLPSPPSGPGTVATARALKRSQTGNLWDGQQSQSRAWRRSMSIGAPSRPLAGDPDRATPSPSQSATPVQPTSTGATSTGARSTGGGVVWPRSSARAIQRSTPGAVGPRGARNLEAHSLPGQDARWPLHQGPSYSRSASVDGTALSYMRLATARAQAPRASPRTAAASTHGIINSPRSDAPGSPTSHAATSNALATAPAAALSATLKSRHAPQPSFSDMVSQAMSVEEDTEVEMTQAPSSLRSMPSFERLSPAGTRGTLTVGQAAVRRQASEPETPTLASRAAPPPPPHASLRRSPASRPPAASRRAGPAAESRIDDTVRAPVPESPFATGMQPHDEGLVDSTVETTLSVPFTQAMAPPAGGPSMHDGNSARTTATHEVYVPPSGVDAVATPTSIRFEMGSAAGGLSSVRHTSRPSPLVIDNPADAASVAASSHHHTVRYEPCDVAIDAVANDRTVVDAEEEFGRATAVAAMPSEGVVGVPSRIGGRPESVMDEALLSAGPIQPLKWWVARPGAQGGDGEGAAMWMSTRKRGPRKETWYDSEAILSRKPSVRFRRTVDLMMPVYNEEREMIGKAKTAIEVHKYCVLVTDVPVDDALQQARKEAQALAAERADLSARGPQPGALQNTQQSALTHSALSMHAETAKDEQHHEQWHMWEWITRQFFARHHQTEEAGIKGESGGAMPPPPMSHHGASASLRSAAGKSQDPVAPHVDRRSQEPRRGVKKIAKPRLAPPSAVAEGMCEAGAGDDVTLLSDRDYGEGWGSTEAPRPPALSRRAGGTDLRHEHVWDRLGTSLLASQLDTANTVEGDIAQAAWRKVMAGATVPEALEKQLCQWLEKKTREEAAAAQQADEKRWDVGGQAGVPRRRLAGAVAESQERTASGRSNGASRTMVGPRRPSRAMSTHDGEVAFIEEEEADQAKHIAVDAAAAAGHVEDDAEEAEDQPSYNNSAREAVSKQVAMAFDSIFFEAKPRLIPVLNHQKVHLELIKWDRLHQHLELVEAKEEARKLKAQRGGPLFKPVMHRVGWLGLFGKLVPSKRFYQDKIAECEWSIDREREDVFANGISRAYFVVFETQMAATIAAQALLHSADARLYKCKAAPGPDDVNWSALWCSSEQRFVRRIIGGFMYFAVMCIPLGAFAGVLTELSKIACDALDEDGELTQMPDGNTSPAGVPISPEDGAVYRDASCLGNQFTRRIVTQVLPAVLVILWQNAIMPLTIYSIALFEKAQLSFSRLDRRILMLFFYWDMFNVFFGAIISGSIVNLVQRLIKSPGDIGVVLGDSLPESSNFFINYLALRAFGLVPFRLILVHGGIWRWLFKCGGSCGCVLSARDAAAFMASASIRYGRELGVMMLVFITAWAYAVVSPLVVVVSAIYFMSSWIVWRWQILYVYVRCYEGGGSLWRSIIACFMSCLYIFVFFTSCVFVAKQAFYQAAFVFVPLCVIISMFWRYLRAKYDPAIKYVPLEVSVNTRRVRINEMSYIAAPLRPKCSGWHPEWGKAWESWGAPAYTA